MFNLWKKEVKVVTRVSEYYYIIDLYVGKKKYYRALNCLLYRNENKIHIGDIIVQDSKPYSYIKYVGKGYGSLMMNELIKFAKENGYTYIDGDIVSTDDSNNNDPTHRQRAIHFYKKFGFKCLPDEDHITKVELHL